MTDIQTLLRSIPPMDALLNTPWGAEYSGLMGRETVKELLTELLDDVKRELRSGALADQPLDGVIARRAVTLLKARASSTLQRVVNATGVVIHTNLGRAPLAEEAVNAVAAIAGAYSTLEYSPENAARSGRNAHIEWLIRRITGAEAALAVNNNAAAVLLALSAVAAGREVIVSAGELVEIGDSFRIPDILAFSGARMITVGCTNAVRISDYRNAITENTAVLLKVHPSNYRIEGFVKTTPREELAELAASRNLVFMEDLGSGLLTSLSVPFANREHSVRECLKAGCGIVTFSGDKLLGGPQIGVIAGAKRLIDAMKRHQLLRALRVDKMTLAAFEATLRLYLCGRPTAIPVVRMIELDSNTLLKKARELCRLLREVSSAVQAEVVETSDAVGGGAYPTDILPGYGVAVLLNGKSPDALATALRTAAVPVIPGVRDGRVILHVRTLLPGDADIIAAALDEVLV